MLDQSLGKLESEPADKPRRLRKSTSFEGGTPPSTERLLLFVFGVISSSIASPAPRFVGASLVAAAFDLALPFAFCGGGAFNDHLMQRLAALVPRPRLHLISLVSA